MPTPAPAEPPDAATATAAADVAAEACERIGQCLAAGAPWEACDVLREALPQAPQDTALLYAGALAHARASAPQQAQVLIDRALALQPPMALRIEALSLRARLCKDHYRRTRLHEPSEATRLATLARDGYLAVYSLHADAFPGINAASLSMVLGQTDDARALAAQIAAGLAPRLATLDMWGHATLGEAGLLQGQLDLAQRHYAHAYALTAGDAGHIATMRRQLKMLLPVLPDAAAVLDALPATPVWVFAGHMIDAPGRVPARFPATLVSAVSAELRSRLLPLGRFVAYCGAACGADLLFIELALAQGAEVNIVLPFEQHEFVRTSVAPPGPEWQARFERALAGATRVVRANEESHLGDDVLFEHGMQMVDGMAMLRVEQLESQVAALCVIDPSAASLTGGTQATLSRWRRRGITPQLVDLASLRHANASVCMPVPAPAPSTPSTTAVAASPVSRPLPGELAQRTIKALLFADVAGFSRLNDGHAPLFHARFLRTVAAQIQACATPPLEANTWGDALYVVFESPQQAAQFALQLLARMEAVDWAEAGLPVTSKIRIALHAGPVFCGFDPVIGRDNYFGASVTKAARIEPVTPPGMVYCSEAFAATLAAVAAPAPTTAAGSPPSDGPGFAFEYVGVLALAKAYGASRIYRLDGC